MPPHLRTVIWLLLFLNYSARTLVAGLLIMVLAALWQANASSLEPTDSPEHCRKVNVC